MRTNAFKSNSRHLSEKTFLIEYSVITLPEIWRRLYNFSLKCWILIQIEVQLFHNC